MANVDIYQFSDFKVWLKEALQGWSYQEFIDSIGLKSKGHVTQILSGQKSVTEETAEKMAVVFKLKGKRREFFFELLGFSQGKTHLEKKIHLDKMVALQRTEAKKIDTAHYNLCKKWYYPVIRELARLEPIRDYNELGKKLVPPIAGREAEKAVRELVKMGLLTEGESGVFSQSDAMISFGDGWKSVAVREFQLHALELQKEALERFAAKDREVANSTLCMSRERAELIKAKLKEFREEILELVLEDPAESEQVFQLNLGFFPLTKEKGSEK